MKTTLSFLLVFSVVSSGAWAYHSHMWTKLTEIDGSNGQTVCQWKCGIGSDKHHKTTSGYGYCPHPGY